MIKFFIAATIMVGYIIYFYEALVQLFEGRSFGKSLLISILLLIITNLMFDWKSVYLYAIKLGG